MAGLKHLEDIMAQGNVKRTQAAPFSPAPLLVQTSPLGLYLPLMESLIPGLKCAPRPQVAWLTSGSKTGAETGFSGSDKHLTCMGATSHTWLVKIKLLKMK